jgi:GT2 family glycosyltransferase
MQHLCKLFPTPADLILRRFFPLTSLTKKRNGKYELLFTGYNKMMEVPILSGCFMFIKSKVFENIGLFDEKFFMYCEDIDLSRRINQQYTTLFFPDRHVYHEYHKEYYKSFRLLIHHIRSAIYYFNKWGWFFDKNRKILNNKILKENGYYNKRLK